MSGSNVWKLRLTTEGADQVVRDLRAAASESAAAARAYDALIKAQPGLATGAERAEQALRKNVDAMRGMRGELNLLGAATQGAASSMGAFGAALTSPTAAIAGLGAAATAGVVQIARLGDQYTETMNKLRAATGSLGAAQSVYAELVSLSQQTGASISESAGAFVRFSVAARSIGATNGEILQLTRTIQQAGIIAGSSTQESAAGVMQLGQALASGRLQGDELRSIMESMPTLAEALARELGVGVGQLRTMGSEGQLTSDRVFQALLRASEGINKQFSELTPTMGRAFSVLGQAMVEFVGKLDQALGLSQAIARAAQAAAAAVGSASRGISPRTPAEQAEFDVAQAERRQAELMAEIERLRSGAAPSSRRGSISRGLQETAAAAQGQEARLAELQAAYEAENRVIAAALDRRNQAHQEADDIRQAEEATAQARRLQAARDGQTTAFNETRDSLDRERKLRVEHADRIKAIEAGLANGNTTAAEAARLRRLANEELADGLKALDNAARGRIETDESLAEVMRIVIDMEKDRDALMREGESVTASVRSEAEKYADTLANLNNLLAAGAISQDTYNRAVAAADPAVKAATEAARRIEQENTRTTDRITSFFGDAFARAFEGTGNGFRGLMESFKRAAISTFASIAAQAIIRPIVAPIVQGLGLGQLGSGGLSLGGLFGSGPMGGAAAVADTGGTQAGLTQAGQVLGLRSAGSFGNLGNAFTGNGMANTGWAGLDGLLNTNVYGGGAGNIAASIPGAAGDGGALLAHATQAPGLSVAGAIGGAASIAGGAYGIYSGLQRGGAGGYTTAAGGALSAGLGVAMLAGATIPVAGWVLAGLLAIAGAALPGQQQSGRGQLSRINLDTDNQTFEGLGGNRFSAGNRDAATNTVNSIADMARRIGDQLGGARIGGDIAVGVTSSRGSGPGQLYLQIGANTQQFANDEAGSKQLAETAARLILQEFKAQGRAQGDYAGILAASGSVEQLSQDLTWYEDVYKTLTKAKEPVSAFQQSLDAMTAQFAPAIQKAQELGLSVDAMTAARDREMAKLREQRDAQVRSFDMGLEARSQRLMGNNQWADIIGFNEQAATYLDQTKASLESLGLSADEVAERIANAENVLSGERLAIIQNYADQAAATEKAAAEERVRLAQQTASAQVDAARSALDWLNAQALGSSSSLSPTARLAEAERQFNAAMSGGDVRALTSAADALLTNSASVYGTATAEYAQIESFTRQTVLNRGNAAVWNGDDAIRQLAAVFQAEVSSLRSLFADMVAETRRANSQAMVA